MPPSDSVCSAAELTTSSGMQRPSRSLRSRAGRAPRPAADVVGSSGSGTAVRMRSSTARNQRHCGRATGPLRRRPGGRGRPSRPRGPAPPIPAVSRPSALPTACSAVCPQAMTLELGMSASISHDQRSTPSGTPAWWTAAPSPPNAPGSSSMTRARSCRVWCSVGSMSATAVPAPGTAACVAAELGITRPVDGPRPASDRRFVLRAPARPHAPPTPCRAPSGACRTCTGRRSTGRSCRPRLRAVARRERSRHAPVGAVSTATARHGV